MILRIMWLLLLLVSTLENGLRFATGIDTNSSARPKSVKIGAIFSFNSTIGKVAKVAVQAAVDDVNNSSKVLQGTKLNISMQDSSQNEFLGIVKTMALMEGEIVAVIGPQSSVIAHVVADIAKGLKIPLLAFAATDPTLSSTEYPFVVPTTQNDLFQMAAIADIVSYFGWREVTAIYTDDNYGRNGIASLSDKLAERQGKISYKAPLSPELNRDDIRNVLFQVVSQESRVLVLHTYDDYGLEVLEVARSLQMFENGYVWITTGWLSDVIDTDSPLSSDAQNDVQGLLTLRPHTPNSQLKENFIDRWSDLLRKYDRNASFGLNAFGLYAYESVRILAYALDEYFAQGGNISFSKIPITNYLKTNSNLHLDSMRIFKGGDLLLSNIYQVNLKGLTGHIQFDQDRYLINPAFEIINVVGTGLHTIGYWSNSSGLSVKPPEALHSKPPGMSPQLLSVIWPGKAAEKPRGWVHPANGKLLKIGVPRRVNYLEFVAYSASTHTFTGYAMDVFTSALALLPYDLSYTLIPFGNGVTNPDMDELIEKLSGGVFDAVVGDIVITTKRARIVDYTQPFLESGLVVVAPVQTKDSDAWAFLWPFTPMLWFVTGISILVLGVVIWILEHRLNDEFRGSPQNQIKTVLWFSCSTWFSTHRETTLSLLGRIVLFIWLFVVLIVKSSYTASLSSIQTVQQLYSPVKGIESLMQSKKPIGYQNGSFSENYLHEELQFPKSQLVPLENENDYAEALRKGPKNGGVAAIVDDMARIQLFLSRRCEYTIRGQKFTKNGRGFAFPRGSPLAVDFSTAILKLQDNGDLQRIHDKWLTKSACRSQDTKLSVDRLELKSFWGLFLLSGLACAAALVLYFGLVVRQFMRRQPPKEEGPDYQTPQSTTCFKKFLAFVNEKEDGTKRWTSEYGRKRQESNN